MPLPGYEDSLVSPDHDYHTDYAIRSRAYALWEEAGRPGGFHSSGRPWAEHFWLTAEAEICDEIAAEEKKEMTVHGSDSPHGSARRRG
jgi:hypothetical protein